MKFKSLLAATAVVASASSSVVAATRSKLDYVPPSASFSKATLADMRTFHSGIPSVVARSLAKVVDFSSGPWFGSIQGFGTLLYPRPLVCPPSVAATVGMAVESQVLASGRMLPTDYHQQPVSGTGVTGVPTDHGATIFAAPVPEPRSFAMILTGLIAMGAIAVRRHTKKKGG
jgi:hypothetical protein